MQALPRALDLARHVESWGYTRYWVAEHHNMPGIASSATAVMVGHIASGTRSIRVGSGGIMLPNHNPLVIAEQFGTLDALFPVRFDLGLGRAPGSDQKVAQAIRQRAHATSACVTAASAMRSSTRSATVLASGPTLPTGPTHVGHPCSHSHPAMRSRVRAE